MTRQTKKSLRAFAQLASLGLLLLVTDILFAADYTPHAECYVEIQGALHPVDSNEKRGFCISDPQRFETRERSEGMSDRGGKHKRYALSIRLVTPIDSPVRNLEQAVFIGDAKVPQLMTSDNDGYLPTIETDQSEAVYVFWTWPQIYVPPGADDYQRSRNR